MQDLGDGNIQAGRVDGDLNNHLSTTNQTIYNIVVVSSESASNEDGTVQAPTELQPPKLAPTAQPKKAAEATTAQRELLRFMASSPAIEARAEAFMRREFETDRVKKLSDFECVRTTKYLEACIQRATAQRA
ncbi:hypothetical protein [Comamonas fluminis]|uniref:hypothetical protein n=1 Tax=Comamonas fluminis TaxID=2796366 RepID=UPI001C4718AA|nr:hypothetical protein [Comamonas fluminis]